MLVGGGNKQKKNFLAMRLMLVVNTHGGKIPLVAYRYQVCPWCKCKRVYLCRNAQHAEGQWIPVEYRSDTEDVHDLHMCRQAKEKNDALRREMGLPYKTWQQRLEEQEDGEVGKKIQIMS